MNPLHTDFAAQWQAMETQKNNLAEEIRKLQVKINNLSQEPEMQALLREKDGLRTEEKELRNEIEMHAERIADRLSFMEEREKSAAEHSLQKLLVRMENIGRHYQQTKKCLEVMLTKTQEQRQLAHQSMLEWAAQDREHLLWALEYQPAYGNVALGRYKERFPGDDLADTPYARKPTFIPTPNFPKNPGRRKAEPPAPPEAKSQKESPCPWRIFIIFDEGEEGIPLPSQREEFLKTVAPILKKRRLNTLSEELLYNKLIETINRPAHPRRKISQITGKRMFHGWKKIKIGRFHRMLCDFNEENHVVRFSLQTHQIYKKIRHS